MRLLTWNLHNQIVLADDFTDETPPYAILSHTWSLEKDAEVTLNDIKNGRGRNKTGYGKLLFCVEQARRDELEYCWVDTCCIDKSSDAELSQSIRSMFKWYKNAKKCYVYLSDVSAHKNDDGSIEPHGWETDFQRSRWFTRGWTLQELLAPDVVEFFSREAALLGDKRLLVRQIHEVTKIPHMALQGAELDQFTINERIRWTENRETKIEEDRAYCLLGFFGLHMPLLYGEGADKAFKRLREEIDKLCGGNVAARLGVVDEIGVPPLRRVKATINQGRANAEDASLANQVASFVPQEETRPTKRARLACESHERNLSYGYSNTNLTSTEALTMITSTHVQQLDHGSHQNLFSAEQADALLKSLLFERIDFRVNNVRRPLPSTCLWLFRQPDFKAWYEKGRVDQHSGFLWMKGKPGCGKSTLMKAALEWIRRQQSRTVSQKIIVPYFFHARASAALEKSRLGLYRKVAHHLISSYPKFRRLFEERFSLKNPESPDDAWTEEELEEFLEDVIETKEPFELYLLVDALDEAEYDDDVRQMIRFFIQLSERAAVQDNLCKLRIYLSSRHYPHIKIGKGLSFVVEEQSEHGRDIERYITTTLTCSKSDQKNELVQEVLAKSARIFLWVVLVVPILNRLEERGKSFSELKARLDTIPQRLHDLFVEILTKSDHDIETSILLFQWMTFRMRPLEPAELYVAMEYSRSPDDQTRIPPAEIPLPFPKQLVLFILDCSRGLVEIAEVGLSKPPVVQFIHETVREFLLKEDGLASIVPALAQNLAGISHEILRVACARRISAINVPEDYKQYGARYETEICREASNYELRERMPFHDYAVLHLFDHAEQAQEHDIDQQTFLETQINVEGSWKEPYRSWWNVYQRYKFKKIQNSTPLSWAFIERGYLHLLSALLSAYNTTNQTFGKRGSLLYQAVCGKHYKAVEILLDNGADVNARGGHYHTALQAAIIKGDERTVQILLDRCADVESQGRHNLTALQAAISEGNERLVQILLDRGADINSQGGSYPTALQAAISEGNERLVQILLDRGADVNSQGGSNRTALQAAFSKGDERIVQILLDRGADVNAGGGYYCTALQRAASQGHKKIVQLLIERGADVNADG